MSVDSSPPIFSLEDAYCGVSKTGEHLYRMANPKLGDLKSHSVDVLEIEPKKSSNMLTYPNPYELTYTIIQGVGEMILGESQYQIKAIQTIVVHSEVKHKIINTGSEMLRFILVSSPPIP